MSSFASASQTNLAHTMKTFARPGKSDVEITLNSPPGDDGSNVTSYSTMDKLDGAVSFTAKQDTQFANIEIAFVGTSTTYVDKFSSSPQMTTRADATHTFLKLTQPMDDSCFPVPRIAEAGRTYRFPFTFVIPDQLLPKSCARGANSQVKAAHAQLPPSMGDPEVSGHGGKLLDNMTPDMAKIIYSVRVTITRARPVDGKEEVWLKKMKKVCVKPAFPEQPPVVIDSQDEEYRLRQEKTIRKGLLGSKAGTLTIMAQQPKCVLLPGARSASSAPVTTSATVLLRFDPADPAVPPPRLGALSAKLKATTYFATTSRRAFPTKCAAILDLTQGMYVEPVPLSSRCVAAAKWTAHAPSPAPRRDSGISDCSASTNNEKPHQHPHPSPLSSPGIPAPSSTYADGPFYTTTLLVPLSLPPNKLWLPTFHACLVSRVYSVDLGLALPGLGKGAKLRLPLQVAAEGSVEGARVGRARRAEVVGGLGSLVEVGEEEGEGVGVEEGSEVRMERCVDEGEGAPPGYEELLRRAPGEGRVGRVEIVGLGG